MVMVTMTKGDIKRLVKQLEVVFDTVRLVDVTQNSQYFINPAGEMVEEPYKCFGFWMRNKRCENCISAKTYISKGRMTKFEFVGQEIYHVTAMYVEVEGVPYVLEIVSKITDEILFGAYGKNEFVETISKYNSKLYADSLTGIYNRRYYEEQLRGLSDRQAVAMLDVDNFKHINDTYGHQAGDEALRAIAGTVSAQINANDYLIRYGGDELLIIFQGAEKSAFTERLEEIRQKVAGIVLESHPGIRLTVSIGGAYCQGEPADLLQEADVLLYKAKQNKNNVQII